MSVGILLNQHKSGDIVYYPGAEVASKGNTGTGTYGDFYTNCNGTSNINSRVVYIPVDLTKANTLTVVGSTGRQGSNSYAGAWLASSASAVNSYPYYTIGAGSSSSNYERMNRHTNTSGAFTWTWDVSALTGTHYLALGCYFNGSSAGAVAITVTSVTGQK